MIPDVGWFYDTIGTLAAGAKRELDERDARIAELEELLEGERRRTSRREAEGVPAVLELVARVAELEEKLADALAAESRAQDELADALDADEAADVAAAYGDDEGGGDAS